MQWARLLGANFNATRMFDVMMRNVDLSGAFFAYTVLAPREFEDIRIDGARLKSLSTETLALLLAQQSPVFADGSLLDRLPEGFDPPDDWPEEALSLRWLIPNSDSYFRAWSNWLLSNSIPVDRAQLP